MKIRLIFSKKTKHCKMTKEIRKDLYTQSEYAKKIGVTRARVNQMIKENLLKTVLVNGATLIKLA